MPGALECCTNTTWELWVNYSYVFHSLVSPKDMQSCILNEHIRLYLEASQG